MCVLHFGQTRYLPPNNVFVQSAKRTLRSLPDLYTCVITNFLSTLYRTLLLLMHISIHAPHNITPLLLPPNYTITPLLHM